MMTKDFCQRPTAQEAFEHWDGIKTKLNGNITRLRLRKPDETIGSTVVNTLADGISSLTSLFDEVGLISLHYSGNMIFGLCRNRSPGGPNDLVISLLDPF
jgi:hypothetical protein